MTRNTTRIWLAAALTAVVGLFVWAYASYDPASSIWFPRCPFKLVTGLDCPGCGSQRSIHALLTGDIAGCWSANPMVLLLTPLAALCFVAEWWKTPRLEPLRRVVLSPYVAWALLVLAIAWTVARNIWG